MPDRRQAMLALLCVPQAARIETQGETTISTFSASAFQRQPLTLLYNLDNWLSVEVHYKDQLLKFSAAEIFEALGGKALAHE